MRQQEPVEEYQGAERDATFVRKFDDRLWDYCCGRFEDRWAGQKRARTIPHYVHEGETGWWFPTVWIADFTDRFGTEIRTKLGPADFDARAEIAARLSARIGEAA
jgi:hypothetical protein